MDLSPISKPPLQDIPLGGASSNNPQNFVCKSLFLINSSSSSSAEDNSFNPPVLGLSELSISASAVATFKKPLWPSSKKIKAKKSGDKSGSLRVPLLPINSNNSAPVMGNGGSGDSCFFTRGGRTQSLVNLVGDDCMNIVRLGHNNDDQDGVGQALEEAGRLMLPLSEGCSSSSIRRQPRGRSSCPVARRADSHNLFHSGDNSSRSLSLVMDRIMQEEREVLASTSELVEGEEDSRIVPSSPYSSPPFPPTLCLSTKGRRCTHDDAELASHRNPISPSITAEIDAEMSIPVEWRSPTGSPSGGAVFRIRHRSIEVLQPVANPNLSSPPPQQGLPDSASPFVPPTTPEALPAVISPFTSPAGASLGGSEGSNATKQQQQKKNGNNRGKSRPGRSLTMSCGSLPLPTFLPSLETPPLTMREAHVPRLPTNPHSSHSDLPCIDPTTLIAILRGKFAHLYTRFFIVDCRFQYEYEGGHIQGTAAPAARCVKHTSADGH